MELHELQPETFDSKDEVKIPIGFILIMIWYGFSILYSLYGFTISINSGSFKYFHLFFILISILILRLLYKRSYKVVRIITWYEIFRISIEILSLLYFTFDKYDFLNRFVGDIYKSNLLFYESALFDFIMIFVGCSVILIRIIAIIYVRDENKKLYLLEH